VPAFAIGQTDCSAGDGVKIHWVDGETTRRAFDGGQVVEIGGLTVTKISVG